MTNGGYTMCGFRRRYSRERVRPIGSTGQRGTRSLGGHPRARRLERLVELATPCQTACAAKGAFSSDPSDPPLLKTFIFSFLPHTTQGGAPEDSSDKLFRSGTPWSDPPRFGAVQPPVVCATSRLGAGRPHTQCRHAWQHRGFALSGMAAACAAGVRESRRAKVEARKSKSKS